MIGWIGDAFLELHREKSTLTYFPMDIRAVDEDEVVSTVRD
jgi:hypothetical protein